MLKQDECIVRMVICVALSISALLILKSGDLLNFFDDKARVQREERVEKMTKKEALDTLFEYLYEDGKQLGEVKFIETERIGYEWIDESGSRKTYLCEVCYSQNGEYLIFELYNELYGSSGIFIRTQMLNDYAVNIYNGEVIPRKLDKEDGTWESNVHYREAVN